MIHTHFIKTMITHNIHNRTASRCICLVLGLASFLCISSVHASEQFIVQLISQLQRGEINEQRAIGNLKETVQDTLFRAAEYHFLPLYNSSTIARNYGIASEICPGLEPYPYFVYHNTLEKRAPIYSVYLNNERNDLRCPRHIIFDNELYIYGGYTKQCVGYKQHFFYLQTVDCEADQTVPGFRIRNFENQYAFHFRNNRWEAAARFDSLSQRASGQEWTESQQPVIHWATPSGRNFWKYEENIIQTKNVIDATLWQNDQVLPRNIGALVYYNEKLWAFSVDGRQVYTTTNGENWSTHTIGLTVPGSVRFAESDEHGLLLYIHVQATDDRTGTLREVINEMRWTEDPLHCGNGLLDEHTEQCDSSAENGVFFREVRTCAEFGFTSGRIGCNDLCEVSTESCSVCGDGKRVEPDEICDDGNTAEGDYCSADCQRITGRCGDTIAQTNEQCDDGNSDNEDNCTTACTLTVCGDGYLQSGEYCDDGNGINNDVCPNNCQAPVCGDGQSAGLETCDDRNTQSGDGCSEKCSCETDNCVETSSEQLYGTAADVGNEQWGIITAAESDKRYQLLLTFDSPSTTIPDFVKPVLKIRVKKTSAGTADQPMFARLMDAETTVAAVRTFTVTQTTWQDLSLPFDLVSIAPYGGQKAHLPLEIGCLSCGGVSFDWVALEYLDIDGNIVTQVPLLQVGGHFTNSQYSVRATPEESAETLPADLVIKRCADDGSPVRGQLKNYNATLHSLRVFADRAMSGVPLQSNGRFVYYTASGNGTKSLDFALYHTGSAEPREMRNYVFENQSCQAGVTPLLEGWNFGGYEILPNQGLWTLPAARKAVPVPADIGTHPEKVHEYLRDIFFRLRVRSE